MSYRALGSGAAASPGRPRASPAKSLRDEIREIVREEIAPLDRRLLALERVSDTNAVTVQRLHEQLTATLSSRAAELEARLGSKLADATAAGQSQLARTAEQLESQLADYLDRLNAIDWAIQRQDVAFARSVDQLSASLNGAQTAQASPSSSSSSLPPPSQSPRSSSGAPPPASPAVSRQGGGLNLQFARLGGDTAASPGGQGGVTRSASFALQETREAQAEALFGQSMATLSSQSNRGPAGAGGTSRRKLKTYLFEEEPESTPLMGLIARDAADIERRCVRSRPPRPLSAPRYLHAMLFCCWLSTYSPRTRACIAGLLLRLWLPHRLGSIERKLETERKVNLAALMDLESKLTQEAAEREHSVQLGARAVLSINRLAANANAGATFVELSRDRGGELSTDDLRVGFHRLGVGVGSAEVEFIAAALDTDGNGSVDSAELEYLGVTAQDVINLATHVEEEVQAGMQELVARMQTEIRGSSLGVRALQRLMSESVSHRAASCLRSP
jgi:hypothetical protein